MIAKWKIIICTPNSYYIKINLKWIKDINVSAKTVKILEENIGVYFCDISVGNIFLNMTPKAQTKK